MKKNKMIFTVFFAFMSIGLYAAKVRILKVESIKGLKKVYCSHTDCSQEVTATLSYGADLPTGATIAWEGDATFEKAEGLKVTANFSKHMGKDKKISVKEGKQTALESSKYDVIDNTPILSVSINFPTPKTVTPPSLGIFGPFPMEADISVFFEHTNHKWATVLTKATVKSVLGASIKGFTEANVSSCTSKKTYEQMCIDLKNVPELPGQKYLIKDAVIAHENAHFTECKRIHNTLFSMFVSDIEELTLSYVPGISGTPEEAKTIIEKSQSYSNKLIKYEKDFALWWSFETHRNGRTDAAEKAANDKRIEILNKHAKNQGWIK